MSKKKKKPFKFTFKVFLRILLFFIVLIMLLFYLFSLIEKKQKKTIIKNNNNSPSVLGDETVNNIYEKLPSNIKESIDSVSQNSAIIYVENKIEEIKEQGGQFVQNQIKEIKKALLKVFFQNINKSIENTYENMVNDIDKE